MSVSEPTEQCSPLLTQKIKTDGAEEEDQQDAHHSHHYLLRVLGPPQLVQHPHRHLRAVRQLWVKQQDDVNDFCLLSPDGDDLGGDQPRDVRLPQRELQAEPDLPADRLLLSDATFNQKCKSLRIVHINPSCRDLAIWPPSCRAGWERPGPWSSTLAALLAGSCGWGWGTTSSLTTRSGSSEARSGMKTSTSMSPRYKQKPDKDRDLISIFYPGVPKVDKFLSQPGPDTQPSRQKW